VVKSDADGKKNTSGQKPGITLPVVVGGGTAGEKDEMTVLVGSFLLKG